MTRGLGTILALSTVLACAPADLSKERALLKTNRDPARLEAAAIAIAASGDAAAIDDLARQLATAGFLRRLDPPRGSEIEVLRVTRVFRALADHPSPATASLSVALASSRVFTQEASRLHLLLMALGAVRPMSEAAANIFRTTSRSGYLESNGPLLAKNASPLAIKVLAELFSDESLNAGQRVSIAHWALLPNRANPAVVSMCARLLDAQGIAPEVQVAIVESLYDYQPRLWFGLDAAQPAPPPWTAVPVEVKELLKSLAKNRLTRMELPPALRTAIRNTLSQLG